jgi:sugar phosphate isomerase/epimerase
MEKRREFLKAAGAIATGSLVVPFGCSPKKASEETVAAPPPPKNKEIGIQIYTLRDEIANDGLEVTMEMVAAAGYKWIEPFGYEDRKFLGKTPTEFKDMLAGMGMRVPSIHSVTEVSSSGGKQDIIDQMKTTAEDAKATGAEYMVWAYLKPEDRTSMDDYKRHIETFNNFSEICKDVGIQFAYHNHDFEFIPFEGETEMPYEMIMRETDSDLVKFEMDLYWVKKADEDPVAWFKKDPGRFHLWHVKDMYPEDQFFAPLGKGDTDFKRIFAERGTSGMKYFFVEQDAAREGKNHLNNIKISWNYLNKAAYV